jgi:hypothetical protein
MSSTGYWIVGAVAPQHVEHLRQATTTASFKPLPAGADRDWWTAMDRAELLAPQPGYTDPGPSETAWRFAQTLEAERPDPEVRDALLQAFEEIPRTSIWHIGVRKGDPVAAVYYGLGYRDASLLPGRFGCFLLDPDEVRTALSGLEHLPTEPAIGHRGVMERAAAWLAAVSDEPELDATTLLEGPIGILRHARDQNLGAIGLMQWF